MAVIVKTFQQMHFPRPVYGHVSSCNCRISDISLMFMQRRYGSFLPVASSGQNCMSRNWHSQMYHAKKNWQWNSKRQNIGTCGTSPAILSKWHGRVSKFGKLVVDTSVATRIQPIDPLAIPEGDEAIVTLLGNENKEHFTNGSVELNRVVTFNENSNCLSVNWPESSHVLPGVTTELLIQIPFPYNVSGVQRSNHYISLEKLENDFVVMQCVQNGNIVYKNLKSMDVEFKTAGNIIAKGYLLGNAKFICSKHGSISANKVQGGTVELRTEAGVLSAVAVYARSIHCLSKTGSISLSSSHGNLVCKSEDGSVDIASVSGQAEIVTKTGDIKVTLDRTEALTAHSEQGNITVFVGPEANISINSISKSLKSLSTLNIQNCKLKSLTDRTCFEGTIGDGQAQVILSTQAGCVEIAEQDWLGSLADLNNVKKFDIKPSQ